MKVQKNEAQIWVFMDGIKIKALWAKEENLLMECEVWWKVETKGCEALAVDEKTNKRVLVHRLLRSLIFSQGIT